MTQLCPSWIFTQLYILPQRYLCILIYCCSIHNNKDKEEAQMSINREWATETQYKHTVGNYSAVKKNKIFYKKTLAAMYARLVQNTWSWLSLPSAGILGMYQHGHIVDWYCFFCSSLFNCRKEPQLSILPMLRSSCPTVFDRYVCSWSTPQGFGLLI